MSDDGGLSIKDFGAAFKGFMEKVASEPGEDSVFLDKLRAHLGADPQQLPIIAETFAVPDHPNLHVAVESWLAEPGRSAELVGIAAPERPWGFIGLTNLLGSNAVMGGRAAFGPVQRVNVPIANDEKLSCLQLGLFLVHDGERRLALLVHAMTDGYSKGVRVEAMSAEAGAAERLLGDLRALMRQRNVYRGQMVSLFVDDHRQVGVQFHRLPVVPRERIILPDGLLERIERQTVRFGELATHLEQLAATSSAAFSSTALLARGRPSPRCTWPGECATAPSSS